MEGAVPVVGWGRCNFEKESEVSGLAGRDMLAIGRWSAEEQPMKLNSTGWLGRSSLPHSAFSGVATSWIDVSPGGSKEAGPDQAETSGVGRTISVMRPPLS